VKAPDDKLIVFYK